MWSDIIPSVVWSHIAKWRMGPVVTFFLSRKRMSGKRCVSDVTIWEWGRRDKGNKRRRKDPSSCR